MDQIMSMMARIDALSIRERGIILVAIIFIMFTLWDSMLMRPQILEERKVLADLQLKRAEQSVLNIKFQNLIRQAQVDSEGASRDRLAALKQQLVEIEADVRQSTNHLVKPDNMALILQTILNRSSGLQLVGIKGLGASPLLAVTAPESAVVANATVEAPVPGQNDPATPDNRGVQNAYKHGLVIQLEGDYMSTLNYMRELESLEWGFFWENIEYEVIEYPRGRVAITLYTLSLEKDWIGV